MFSMENPWKEYKEIFANQIISYVKNQQIRQSKIVTFILSKTVRVLRPIYNYFFEKFDLLDYRQMNRLINELS